MQYYTKLTLSLCAPAIATALTLSACGYIESTRAEKPINRDYQSGSLLTGAGQAGVDLTQLFTPAPSSGNLPVNAILWRAALDTIAVIPIDDIDTFSGTILSEWYPHPANANERIKVALFVVDRELRADGIRAQVYVQQKQGATQDATWTDTGQDKALATRLEDLILTRAREIRAGTVQQAQ